MTANQRLLDDANKRVVEHAALLEATVIEQKLVNDELAYKLGEAHVEIGRLKNEIAAIVDAYYEKTERLLARNEKLSTTASLQHEYIGLLQADLQETMGLAHAHGWRSNPIRTERAGEIRALLETP